MCDYYHDMGVMSQLDSHVGYRFLIVSNILKSYSCEVFLEIIL
jgi:hypothetical protein